ncbi:MAG TPA: HAMP domain-containing protein [Spirochaetota bacterium]|nr:HAMP domain-containing protein [Spirochaetota bacterium]HPI91106.1 HAMP domain-containing protein [Spirochaetota bacterium]HPR48687.1 HAMP domain-containing protein [Spirochaetota bacterium]
MILLNKKPTSRLKKKLLLYFLLISIVSISVSAEIIFEVSSSRFKNSIKDSFYSQCDKKIPAKDLESIKNKMDDDVLFSAINDLRNRMILLLLVISASIVAALILFTRDIVSPMDDMVEATKKIADGDLTVSVPVISNDEIGQIGDLINSMNEKLLDMIIQVKQDLNRHKDKMKVAASMINDLIGSKRTGRIMENKKMRLSDFRTIIKAGRDMVNLLEIMSSDLTSLQNFVNMYKTYTLKTELSQDEIEDAIKDYETRT